MSSKRETPLVVLTIAGFDPTGGAGVGADLKTFAAHGCYGVSTVTAVANQDTRTVRSVEPMPAVVLEDQLAALLSGDSVSAVKIGMLATGALVETVAAALERFHPPNVVLDPVLRSSSGTDLIDADGIGVLRDRLLGLCDVVTPNRDEAFRLAKIDPGSKPTVDAVGEAGRRLLELGAKAVVITGGDGDPPEDVLFVGEKVTAFTGEKITCEGAHGTGCAFSSAIAAHLAAGDSLTDAVAAAKAYVAEAIRTGVAQGQGARLLNHFNKLARGLER